MITGNPPASWHPAPDKRFDTVIEETIVHELLHLLVWETTSAICLLAPHAKTAAYETAFRVQEHNEENFVDRLSVALVSMAHGEAECYKRLARTSERCVTA